MADGVSLTDGLDGLAGGIAALAFIGMSIVVLPICTVGGIKPIAKQDILDLEAGDGGGYTPVVLVQIPMCNEKEVYQQSIANVCQLDWPKSKMFIQILDDSDDPVAQTLIKEEVHKWQQEGANILYRHRVLREGYKAGNLKSAMTKTSISSCTRLVNVSYVTIWTFENHSNWLWKSSNYSFMGVVSLILVFAGLMSYFSKFLFGRIFGTFLNHRKNEA